MASTCGIIVIWIIIGPASDLPVALFVLFGIRISIILLCFSPLRRAFFLFSYFWGTMYGQRRCVFLSRFLSAIFCVFDVSPFLLFFSCIRFCHIFMNRLIPLVRVPGISLSSLYCLSFFFCRTNPLLPLTFHSIQTHGRPGYLRHMPRLLPYRNYTPFPDLIPFFSS